MQARSAYFILLAQACRLAFAAPTPDIAESYNSHAVAALQALQAFYNNETGLWNTCGWWNAANCLTVIGDLAAAYPSMKTSVNDVMENTFTQAPKVNPLGQVAKVVTAEGFVTTYGGHADRKMKRQNEADGFIDYYYDDNGWWALGWIQAYDVTQNSSYLETAEGLFDQMASGGPTYCNGGIYWSQDDNYVNAIANELFLSVGSHLANRVGAANKAKYLNAALAQWTWFLNTGMINAQNTINDGLTSDCVNNQQNTWSYNQGVVLGALVELNRAAPNKTYLQWANKIAKAAIETLADSNMVIHDVCEPNCGADGAQFKGVFMRNLRMLHNASPHALYKKVIEANAKSIWSFDRNPLNQFSTVWSGPFIETANCSTQSSAMDALVAAVNLL